MSSLKIRIYKNRKCGIKLSVKPSGAFDEFFCSYIFQVQCYIHRCDSPASKSPHSPEHTAKSLKETSVVPASHENIRKFCAKRQILTSGNTLKISSSRFVSLCWSQFCTHVDDVFFSFHFCFVQKNNIPQLCCAAF